jgi:hypothetical protein
MHYDPATHVRAPPRANTGSHGGHQPVGAERTGDSDGGMSRQAPELDDWEDDGGSTLDAAPEAPGRKVGRHFDEFSG